MRPNKGASPLTCRSEFEIVPVFRRNDLLALMLNFQTPGGRGRSVKWKMENVKWEEVSQSDSAILHFTLYTLHSPFRFPDYVPAPRNAPREIGILYKNFS